MSDHSLTVQLASQQYSVEVQIENEKIKSMKKIAIVSGDIDGNNTVFVLAHPPLVIFWQNAKLVEGAASSGYVLSGGGLTATLTDPPETDDSLEAYGNY